MERRDIILSPLVALGAVVVGLAPRHRSWLLAGVGVAAMVADQRLPLARRFNLTLIDRLAPPPPAE